MALPLLLVLQGSAVLEAQSASLRIQDVTVYPGQSDVSAAVFGLSSDPISGFQIALQVDSDRIQLQGIKADLTRKRKPRLCQNLPPLAFGPWRCGQKVFKSNLNHGDTVFLRLASAISQHTGVRKKTNSLSDAFKDSRLEGGQSRLVCLFEELLARNCIILSARTAEPTVTVNGRVCRN